MLNEEQLKKISDATLRKTVDIVLKNAADNSAYIEKTIKDIRNSVNGNVKPSLVISAGPSLHRRASIETIKK